MQKATLPGKNARLTPTMVRIALRWALRCAAAEAARRHRILIRRSLQR